MIFQRGHFNNTIVNESVIKQKLNETRAFSTSTASSLTPTVFLSHKHDDLNDLRGFTGLLETLGVKVYIDSMDNKMPTQTSGDTAVRIKQVIKYCNKFILLATPAAIKSYWCNWELGIGDTHKYSQHLALLPMKDQGASDSGYIGNEYLQIYASIDYEDGSSHYKDGTRIPAGYYHSTPANREGVRSITLLKTWLAN